jgi:uncharacterized protein (DUF58 family)
MSVVTRYLDPSLIERLNALQLSARSVVAGATLGQHRSPVRGASIEFRQHRAYVPGDEPRRLDWRVLARTDRPYVREYDEETNLRCAVLLDCSGSMGYGSDGATKRRSDGGNKFQYAAKVVASLSYLMLAQGESVGVGTFAARIERWLSPHAGTQQMARVIDALERSEVGGKGDAAGAVAEAAERLDRRALVVLVSDLFCDAVAMRKALARLKHARHETIVLRVLDDDEVSFPFRGWMKVNGMEGERAKLCEAGVAKQKYLKAFGTHEAKLREACAAVGAEMHTFTTGQDVGDALVGFLRHRA